jgi:hypothetical protein
MDPIAYEQSALAASRTARLQLIDIGDVLAIDPSAVADAAAAAEEAHRSIVEFLARWRRLAPASAARAAIQEVHAETHTAMDLLARSAGLAGVEALLADDLIELSAEAGRAVVADVINTYLSSRDKSLRALARDAGCSPGYISELRSGTSGLPSQAVTDALAASIGEVFAETVAHARSMRSDAAIRQQAARTKLARVRGIDGQAPRPIRVEVIAQRLSADDELLATVEALISLPRVTRTTIRRLAVDLGEQVTAPAD